MVIWIIGLSGSGKTTLANKVIADANKMSSVESKKSVLIDGDVIREVFNHDIGYSMQDRLTNAKRICQLGKFLDSKGVNVICAILSIFPETRKWNRENIEDYYEVFIDTPIETLVSRDSKGIYRKFKNGEITDVAGMDIDFPVPKSADLVINNNTSINDLLSHSDALVELLCQ
tara:strand:+ start:22746 stop:23264 length:519 start_codon:yes stop_codon:yes gene_type:complete